MAQESRYRNERPLLIAGHPRSGTLYISKCLQSVGVKARHEIWRPEVEVCVSYFHLHRKGSFRAILHQVRNPLNVVRSKIRHPQTWGNMFALIGRDPPARKATNHVADMMWTWVHLNRLFERFAAWRYRIEDIDTVWPEVLQWVGLDEMPLPDIPKTTNHRKSPLAKLTPGQVRDIDPPLFDEMMELAGKYGYEPNAIDDTQPRS